MRNCHKAIAIHTCVDTLKMDGQRKKQSLDYFSCQLKKTKSSENGDLRRKQSIFELILASMSG